MKFTKCLGSPYNKFLVTNAKKVTVSVLYCFARFTQSMNFPFQVYYPLPNSNLPSVAKQELFEKITLLIDKNMLLVTKQMELTDMIRRVEGNLNELVNEVEVLKKQQDRDNSRREIDREERGYMIQDMIAKIVRLEERGGWTLDLNDRFIKLEEQRKQDKGMIKQLDEHLVQLENRVQYEKRTS